MAAERRDPQTVRMDRIFREDRLRMLACYGSQVSGDYERYYAEHGVDLRGTPIPLSGHSVPTSPEDFVGSSCPVLWPTNSLKTHHLATTVIPKIQ